MRASACLGLAMLVVAGCCLPGDRESLRPLPEGIELSYNSVIKRARDQASIAVEAFYIDDWRDLEEAAKSLQESARLLRTSQNPPEAFAGKLPAESKVLNQEARILLKAALNKDVKQTNKSLQRIQYKIRLLYPKSLEPDEGKTKPTPITKPNEKKKAIKG